MQSKSPAVLSVGLAHLNVAVCFHRAFDMTRDVQQGISLVPRIPYASILMADAAAAQLIGTCVQSHISVMC